MSYCLTKDLSLQFKRKLKSGEIDPAKLAVMSSLERHAFFASFLGEDNAKNVNSLFESKLLLKSKQKGMVTWAKTVTGMKPKIKNELMDKIKRLDKILSPQEEKAFLKDLASTKLGTDITPEEAKNIMDLSNKVDEAKVDYKPEEIAKLSQKEGLALMRDKVKNKARLAYGDAVIALDNYVTGLKLEDSKITFADFKKNPIGTIAKGVKTGLDLSKAMNASYDDSAVLNQGFPILANIQTAPIWAKNAVGTLVNLVKTFGGQPVWDKVRADVVSRPNYINGLYKAQKLAVNVLEEQFPTTLPEKLANIGNKNVVTKTVLSPLRLFGKGYKATEVAFNVFQLRNRVDTFDLFAAFAEKHGLESSVESTDIEGLGKFVNSLTSRGNMGAFEPVANLINAPFFSLRKQVSGVESLFGYQFGKKSLFVRRLGAAASLQQLSLIALILGIAYATNKNSVELDSTSSDFGKIRIGSTRFDLTQGRAGYLILAMRILLNQSKSSTTGKITPLNTGQFGSMTSTDLLVDFSQNKLSPALSQLLYIINRTDRSGNKPTIKSILSGLYVPLNFQSTSEMVNNPDSANYIGTSLANFFGVQTNIYANSNSKSQLIPTNAPLSNDSFIDAVTVYAKALGTDPETAFNRIFTGQKIVRVTNGTIMVERMSLGASQAAKKAGGGNNPQMKLDHTIPLELGGSNDRSNLKVVTTSEWSSYTKVENALGAALKAGKISKEEAQSQIKKFKAINDSTVRKTYGQSLIDKYR